MRALPLFAFIENRPLCAVVMTVALTLLAFIENRPLCAVVMTVALTRQEAQAYPCDILIKTGKESRSVSNRASIQPKQAKNSKIFSRNC